MKSSFSRIFLGALVLVTTFFGGYLTGGSHSLFGARRPPGKSDPLTLTAFSEDAGQRVAGATPMANAQFEKIVRQPWTRERLVQTMNKLLAKPNRDGALRPMLRFAEQLEAGDFPLALEALKGLAGQARAEVAEDFLIPRWAELNPRAAADYLLKNPRLNSQGENESLRTFTEQLYPVWVQADAAGAASWARSLADPRERERQLKWLTQTVAEVQGNEAAADFVKTNAPELIENGELRPGVLELVGLQPPEEAARHMAEVKDVEGLCAAVGRWEWSDAPAALAWADKLEDAKLRAAALERIFWDWGIREPAAAAAALAKVANPPEGLAAAIATMTSGWAGKDEAAARAWAEQLPEGKERSAAFQGLGERAAFGNRAAGETWLGGLPRGADRDAAASGFLAHGGKKAGAEAMELALSIGEEAVRSAAFRKLAGSWFGEQPGAAFEWLASDAGVAASEKRRLLREK